MKSVYTFLFIFLYTFLSGQGPTFFNLFSSPCLDDSALVGENIHETEEGFIIVGFNIRDCIFLLALDSLGNEINSNQIEAPQGIFIRTAVKNGASIIDSNGDLVIFGEHLRLDLKDSTYYDSYLIKIETKTLDTLWTKIYKNRRDEESVAIRQRGNRYILLRKNGYPYIDPQGNPHNPKMRASFLELDMETGDSILHSEIPNNYDYVFPAGFEVIADNHLALLYKADFSTSAIRDGFVSLLDSNYIEKWKKDLKHVLAFDQLTMTSSRDRKIIYPMTVDPGIFDPFGTVGISRVFAYDLNGEIIWESRIPSYTGYYLDVGSTCLNGDILAGGRNGQIPNHDYSPTRISRITKEGQLDWQYRYPNPFNKPRSVFIRSIIETSDGGILSTGSTADENNLRAVFVMKTLSNGCFVPTCDSLVELPYYQIPTISSTSQTIDNEEFTIFPNPSFGIIQVAFSDKLGKVELQLFAMTGEQVFSERIKNNQEVNLTSTISNGIYFYRIVLKDGRFTTGKLIIHK